MKQFQRYWTHCMCMGGLVTVLMAGPLWGQKTQPPSQPSGSAPRTSGQPVGPSRPSSPQMQTPLFVNGRVLLDTGQPVPEPVSVGLSCGVRTVQVIHTDLKGNFQFVLGAGVQSNADNSASNDTFTPFPTGGTNVPSGFGGLSGSGQSLFGCELRVSVSGYQPLTKTITDPGDIGGINAGTLELRRIAGVQGSSISVTSLLVPDNARKEFDKGDRDARSNRVASATQHLEKAVAEYDKYAAAWNELGTLYLTSHETDKAHQAFEKAIASDSKYILPYLSLAALELQSEEYESAVETAGKALELDPGISVASFIEAAGDFKLNRLDAAEKSALEAEKAPDRNIPQLHVLLADIFMQKQDYPHAAMELRAYLKESSQGTFAGDVKERLKQIEQSSAEADSKSSGSPKESQTAP